MKMKKIAVIGILLIVAATVLGSFGNMAELKQSNAQSEPEKDLTLIVGSPLVLSGDSVSRLDSENPDIAPKILSQRTLVPLRAISEHFNAEVSYSDVTRKAAIVYNGKTTVFGVDQPSFTFAGAEYPLETAAQLTQGRILVPLRAIAETVLGKVVSYDSGIIFIGETEKDITDSAFQEMVVSKIGQAKRPQTLEALKAMLGQIEDIAYNKSKAADEILDGIARTAAPAFDQVEAEKTSSGSFDAGYSETNVQVEGIDEADIVKTDGKNIYIAANRTVYIVSADGSDMMILSKVALDDDRSIREMYSDGSRLVIIGQKYNRTDDVYIMDGEKLASSSLIYPYYNRSMVFISVYSLENPAEPEMIRELEIEGNLSTSRKNGDYLYVIANKYMYGVDAGTAGAEDLMPLYRDGENTELAPVGIDKVICPPIVRYPSYATIAALDLANPDEAASIESILGAADRLYMNAGSLYLTRTDYINGGQKTAITRFGIDGTKIGYSASGAVPGDMQDQFWMDEQDGYLRIATTDTANGSNLFILDESLNPVGQITGIAKGEQIYSVRFIGDAGYIVTFRTIDPLFAIDLSDPQNPVIKGELKIPGFSEYLHPVGENLLLGIGRDTKEMYIKDQNGKETVVGTYQGGIKLSLFDVSDLTAPVEKDVLVLGGQGSYSEALYNHKAILTDTAQSIIGFDVSLYDDESRVMSFNGAVLIGIGSNGLFEKGRVEADLGQDYDGEVSDDIPYFRRLVYIGNTLYYLQDGKVRAFNYTTLSKLGALTLK